MEELLDDDLFMHEESREERVKSVSSKLKPIEPKEMLGRVTKLGDWKWSQNDRLLKLDQDSLSYYKQIPKDFNAKLMESHEITNSRTLKPAFSIPLEYITEIADLTVEEHQKFKKHFAEGFGAFKVVFDSSKLIKGIYMKMALTETSDKENKVEIRTDKLQTWYFSTGFKLDDVNGGAVRDQWLTCLAHNVKQRNENVHLAEAVTAAIKRTEPVETFHTIPSGAPQVQQSGLNNPAFKQDSKNTIEDKILKRTMEELLDQNLNINQQSKKEDKRLKDPIQTAPLQGQQPSNEKKNQVFDRVQKYFSKEGEFTHMFTTRENLGWDLKFQNYWGHIRRSDLQGEQKNTNELSEHFIAHIGNFRTTAQKVVVSIINELHKPPSERVHQEIQINQKNEAYFQVFLDEDNNAIEKTKFFFNEKLTHKIIVKLTYQGHTYHDEVSGPADQDATQANNDDTVRGIQTGSQKERYWWKRFGREFLSYDIMFDALYMNSKGDDQLGLRVPLVTLVDYKGFRALCIAYIQIDNTVQPALGFYQEKYSCQDESLKQALRQVGDCLNLKDNKLLKKGFSQQFEVIPVSSQIKIYGYQNQEEQSTTKTKNDSPTMKHWFTHHYQELEYTNSPLYVIQTADIFPYDWEVNDRVPNTNKVLRPEFVCQYERPLKSDTKKNTFKVQKAREPTREPSSGLNKRKPDTFANKDDEDQNDVMELNEASRVLRRSLIQQLVDLLDSLIIVPIDSQTLEQVFHIQGVNMRYLGLVCSLSSSPHIQDICITEMVARTLKRIFNTHISLQILKNQENLVQIAHDLSEVEQKLEQLHAPYETAQYIAEGRGANPHSKLNPGDVQQELLDLKQQLLAEQDELNGDMDKNVKNWTHDFMNLVFGHSEEQKLYREQVILPQTAAYYIYLPLEDLMKHEIRLNALYFALIDLIGLKCFEVKEHKNERLENIRQPLNKNAKQTKAFEKSDEESFFKIFGKIEAPFGEQKEKRYDFEYVPKSRTYQLRNLPYTRQANKFQEYKDNDQIVEAFESCKMRFNLKSWLQGKKVALTQTNADMCTIYLEKQKYDLAIEYATKALQLTHPLHASSIKFYCILMQAYYLHDQLPQADVYFTTALSILDHHWGPFHPLHVSIYGIMAQLLIEKKRYDDAKYLYQASLLCCMRLLGPNHIQTGEVHMDFGKLYLKTEKKRESLQHFTEAYLIYESYFGTTALQTAEAAINIANLLEEQKRLPEAFKYAEAAAKTYQNVYNQDNPNTIKVLWQLLTISYELKHESTERQANNLLKVMVMRDGLNPPADQGVEDLKILVIATIIMEVTRRESVEDKRLIKTFCDKLLFNKKLAEAQAKHEEIIPSLIDYHFKQIDAQRISQIKRLSFPIKGKEKLRDWYQQSLRNQDDQTDGDSYFLRYYKRMLQEVKEKEASILKKREQQIQQALISKTQNGTTEGEEKQEQTHTILIEESESFDQSDFFMKLIQTFEDINFYNLIMH